MRYIELNFVRATQPRLPSNRQPVGRVLQVQDTGQYRWSWEALADTGIRRTQKRPGRPAGKSEHLADMESQTDFGF